MKLLSGANGVWRRQADFTTDRAPGYGSVKLFVIKGFSANSQVKLEVQRSPSSPTACFCRRVPNAVERTKMPGLPLHAATFRRLSIRRVNLNGIESPNPDAANFARRPIGNPKRPSVDAIDQPFRLACRSAP